MVQSPPPFHAVVCFKADSSVGLMPYSYTVEIPDFRDVYDEDQLAEARELRELTRSQLITLYSLMDGDSTPTVRFSDETEMEPPLPEFDEVYPLAEAEEPAPSGDVSPSVEPDGPLAAVQGALATLTESMAFPLSELDQVEIEIVCRMLQRLLSRHGLPVGDPELESIFVGGLLMAPRIMLTPRERLAFEMERMELVPYEIRLNVYTDTVVRRILRHPTSSERDLLGAATSVEMVYREVEPFLNRPP